MAQCNHVGAWRLKHGNGCRFLRQLEHPACYLESLFPEVDDVTGEKLDRGDCNNCGCTIVKSNSLIKKSNKVNISQSYQVVGPIRIFNKSLKMLSVVCCMYKKDQNVSRTIELSARPVMAVKRPHPGNKMEFFLLPIFFWTISVITFTQLNHQGSAVWSNGRQLTPPTNTMCNQNSKKGKYQRLTEYTA